MYRVKEVEGIFIPQKFSWIGWYGIDKTDTTLWLTSYYQKSYCKLYSLESARERIKSYRIQIDKPRVKYHKEK